jgi:hypothetical protein
MGLIMSRVYDHLFTRDTRILMLGLDAAGKTTLLYKLKLGENVTTIPVSAGWFLSAGWFRCGPQRPRALDNA